MTRTHGMKQMVTVVGTGALGLLALNGCATTAATNAFDPSLSTAQYAQISEDQCTGIPAKEREAGIFAYRDAIANAQPLKETEMVGKTKFLRDRGVEIAVRAQPGMSAPWLERIAACHTALVRANLIATSGDDPTTLPGASVHVDEAYTGYRVRVYVRDGVAAAEAMRRTTASLAPPPSPLTASR